MKKIGIIGSGIVGKTLALGFVKYGYDVMIGSRTPDNLREWIGYQAEEARAGDFNETAEFGDILVLAVKGIVAQEVLRSLDTKHLKGKTIIDATNPISEAPPESGVLKFFTDLDYSLMEELQITTTEANLVKAFNSVGNAFMVDPDFGGDLPTMFICGNNSDAKQEVYEILRTFGWDVEDLGAMEAARAIEPLCMLWCIPGILEGRWNHAFKLLRK